jgi:site-specific DNA-methyltransferase (adenine-specific)
MRPYFDGGGVTLYHGDCLDVLPTLGVNSIDAVITDPPWGINGGSGQVNLERGKGNYDSLHFEDTSQYINDVVIKCIKYLISICECVIVMPGASNMCMYPQPDSFGCFYQPAAIGMQTFGLMDASPIFYYGKNATRKNFMKRCSYHLTERPEKNGHPCVKPIKVWMKIVENNTLPGQLILDPFAGSGTTPVAAIRTGRRCIAIELEERYCEIAAKRIERELLQPRLFVPEAAEPEAEQGALFGGSA